MTLLFTRRWKAVDSMLCFLHFIRDSAKLKSFIDLPILVILQSTPAKSFSIKIIDLLWKINAFRNGNKWLEYPVKYTGTLFLSLLNMQNSE